jgi:plastocyanin
MRKGKISASIAILAAAAAMALTAPAGASAATTITVGNNFFSPSQKTVSVGTKVRFRWTGGRRHNVTKTGGPGGAIESRTTNQSGVNFANRFGRAGTYRFVCTLHPTEMRLKLKVR